MVLRFWVAVVVFHAGLIAIAARIAWDWRHRAGLAPYRWRQLLVRDWAVFALAALILGGVLAVGPSGGGFLTVRLLSQALFGEAVFLLSWLVVLHLKGGRAARALLLGVVVLGLLGAYAEAYHVGPHDLRLRHYRLDRSAGMPARGQIRVLHLSDIQTDRIGPYEERALREGLGQAPDLILFTGDYVQERLGQPRPGLAADFRALLHRVGLRAPLGVYAVQGDTDPAWPGLFDGTGVVCLYDRAARLPLPGGASLSLVGLSRAASRNRNGQLLRAVESTPETDLRFVMGHSPDYVATLARYDARVDLAFAGHTHGGQVAVPGFGPLVTSIRLPRRFAGGLNTYEGIPLCVSRGIGMERREAPQIRFFCPPEIVIVDVTY